MLHYQNFLTCYCPQTKFAKVMFSQVSICPREGCLPHCMLPHYTHPPWADPPRADIPLDRHPPLQTPPGQTTPGRHPPRQTPPAQCITGTVHKQALRIPLECILVFKMVIMRQLYFKVFERNKEKCVKTNTAE